MKTELINAADDRTFLSPVLYNGGVGEQDAGYHGWF